jgi:hypothetical protein
LCALTRANTQQRYEKVKSVGRVSRPDVNHGNAIRHEHGFERHVDNIHYNPVKTGVAQRPSAVMKNVGRALPDEYNPTLGVTHDVTQWSRADKASGLRTRPTWLAAQRPPAVIKNSARFGDVGQIPACQR